MKIKLFLKKIFKYIPILIAIIFSLFLFTDFSQAALNLNGRILLQVEDKGQAWYVNPLDSRRYYLGRPDDAFAIMRSLGLGISNRDLNYFAVNGVPVRLSGRILLQVEDKGQAYYVDPLKRQIHYLGRPADAFNLMRQKGLGITNRDLALIPIEFSHSEPPAIKNAPTSPVINQSSSKLINFNFKYRNQNYQLSQSFSDNLYEAYKNSPKVYSYRSDAPPTDFREAFYGLFLTLKSGDSSLDELIFKVKEIANQNNWTSDELLEFTIAMLQYIPYDDVKVSSSNSNVNPYFPYETLYLNKGVCSDKTFLAVALLRKLGYGAAILDFPEINHSALGLACPKEYSLDGSGYCYVETTNYFPPGIIPSSISNGQAQTNNTSQNFFDRSNLGRLEIYQKTAGDLYQGLPNLIIKINNLQAKKADLNVKSRELEVNENKLDLLAAELEIIKGRLDVYYVNQQLKEYNNLVVEYNQKVNAYNNLSSEYKLLASAYNTLVIEVNTLTRDIYQR